MTPQLLDAARGLFNEQVPDLGSSITDGVKFLTQRYGYRVPEVLKHFL